MTRGLWALSCASIFGLTAPTGTAFAQTWKNVEPIVQIVGEAEVLDEGLQLTLPLVAEDGSSVPLSISANLPGARITRLALFAPGNPTPQIAEFEFGEDIAAPNLSTRIRLSESQTVIAVAVLDDGRRIIIERPVRVTTSGCIAPAQSDPANELNARVRVPGKLKANAPAEVITMISHPMITGLAKDKTGAIPEQRIIEQFQAAVDDRIVLKARYFRSLAANPYLKFEFAPPQGSHMDFEWIENTGRSVQHTENITVS